MNLKDDINNKWMIEETYTSDKCRHRNIRYMGLTGYMESCLKNDKLCTKENCPLKVGGKK